MTPRRREIRALCLVLALGLPLAAGCAGSRRASASAGDPAVEQAALAQSLRSLGSANADYRIGPADLVSVTVFENDKLDREVRVAQDGTVSLPLAGLVRLGGLTVTQAENEVAARLKRYILEPQVTVFVRTEGVKKVFVLGQVLKPGACELPPEGKLTVLGAISMAGGFSPIAAADRTRIIRSVNGKSETLVVKLSAATKRGEQNEDVALKPDDIVYVPQTFF